MENYTSYAAFFHPNNPLPRLLKEHIPGVAVLFRRNEIVATLKWRHNLAHRVHEPVCAPSEVRIDQPDVINELEASLLDIVLEANKVQTIIHFSCLPVEFGERDATAANANVLGVEDI